MECNKKDIIKKRVDGIWKCSIAKRTEAEFKEFKSRLNSAKTRFKLSADLNLETFDTILSETNQN